MKKFLCCVLTISMSVSLLAGMTVTASADTLDDNVDDGNSLTVKELMAELDGSSNGNALDDLYANFSSGISEDGSADISAFDYDENQVTDELSTLSEDEYPDAFDLRHVGGTVTYNEETMKNDITGGKSYVTPVKFQNPWGTCWAFGIIAASESSILYESGLGSDTEKNTNIDLSEHHLAWFAKNHLPAVTEDGYDVNNQEGEGIWYTRGTANSTMEGGMPFFGTSVFASGVGVVTEEFAPYCGKNGNIICARNKDADEAKYPKEALTYDSMEAWLNETDEGIKANYSPYMYSPNDDWSLDESTRFYQSYVLEESSVLPSVKPTKDATTGDDVLNVDGINAVKSELMQGRAVEMAFYADSSDPNAPADLNTSRYINSNYAHYTWDRSAINHSVCIIGWDDDYDASNFGQDNPVKYDENGRAIFELIDEDQELEYSDDGQSLYYIDEDDEVHQYALDSDEIQPAREEEDGREMSTPEGNGAWIVKNSWGSSDSEFPNKHTWGADGSGFFYVSYYDTSVSFLETFDFAVGEETEEYDYKIIDQYDYMTAESVNESVAYSPVMMANVFTADEDMEIEAVSCETTTPGTSVICGICLLDDDEDCPEADDTVILNSEDQTYKYGGYHRQELDNPITVSKGQKYAVIAIESYKAKDEDGNVITKYAICSNTGYTEEYAEEAGSAEYYVGVINRGESFVITNAYNSDELASTDYLDYITYVKTLQKDGAYKQYDNFSIKAYGVPTTVYKASYSNLPTDPVTTGETFTADVCITSDSDLASAQLTIGADGTYAKIIKVESSLSNFASEVSNDGTEAKLSFYGNTASGEEGLKVATITYEAVAEGYTGLSITDGIVGRTGDTKDYDIDVPDDSIVIISAPISVVEYGGNYCLVKYEPTAGKAYTYDGNAMYSKDGAFYCVISKNAKADSLLVEAAQSGTAYADVKKGDVNENEKINVVDAQISYDIAAGKYSGFDTLTSDQIVKADVNEDMTITAADARAIQVYVYTGSFAEK